MKKNYDEAYASSFIKGINKLTGISESKLKKYATENNLFNVLEHPNIIDPSKPQLEKNEPETENLRFFITKKS